MIIADLDHLEMLCETTSNEKTITGKVAIARVITDGYAEGVKRSVLIFNVFALAKVLPSGESISQSRSSSAAIAEV